MEKFYRSTGILIDIMALVLSFSLVYYCLYFRDKKEKNILQLIPFLVLFTSIIELVNYPILDNASFAVLDNILQYIEAIVQSVLLCLVVQLLVDNMPFIHLKNGKTNYKFTIQTFILALILTIPFNNFTNAIRDEEQYSALFSYSFFFNIRIVLVLFIFFFGVVLKIISRIKKEKEAIHFINNIFIMVAIYFLIRLAEGLIITGHWSGDSMGFALGFSFFYTISNTKYLLAGKEKEALISADLNMAQNIQQDAIPKLSPAFIHHQDVVINAFMATAKDVGGDFYDYFEIDENHICFLIADVSGKGMPAALFMMTAQTLIKTLALKTCDTAKTIKQADEILAENNNSMMFVTVWIGILNTETLELECTNAGHNLPVLIKKDGSCKFIDEKDGLMVGTGMSKGYTSHKLQISTGDRLFLYTDGVPEAHSTHNELLGDDRMMTEIKAKKDQPGDELIKAIKKQVDDFSFGRDQFDDVTMMCIDFNLIKETNDGFDGLGFLKGL